MSTEKLKRTTQVCSQKKKKTPKLKTQTCSHQIKHSKQWEAVELATIEYHCEHSKEINSESIYEQVFERSHTTCTLDSILLVIKTRQQAFLNLKPVKVNFFNKTFWFCFFFFSLLCILPTHCHLLQVWYIWKVHYAYCSKASSINNKGQNWNYHMTWSGIY